MSNMLKSLTNEFDEIVINVASEYSIAMHISSFIGLFEDENQDTNVSNEKSHGNDEVDSVMKQVIDALRNDYIEMPAPTVLFYREEKPYMFEATDNGVYTTPIPFNMHLDSNFNIEYDILNKLFIPKGTKILFVGNMVNCINISLWFCFNAILL